MYSTGGKNKDSLPLQTWNRIFFVLLIFLLRLALKRGKKQKRTIKQIHARSANGP